MYFAWLFVPLLFSAPFISSAQERDSVDSELDSLLNKQIVPSTSLFSASVSSAAKYHQILGEAPASVTIITSEEIARYGYQTLQELLNQVRGFFTSYDRNYSYLGIRGFGRPTDYNNRLLLLLNGHPLNDNIYGSGSVGNDLGIDPSSIERIEIVRGPNSALYGTYAMFAVINLITKKGKEIEGVQVAGKIGSYGNREATFMAGKEFDSGVDAFLSGIVSTTDGQDIFFEEYNTDSTNHGIAENLDWEKYYNLTSTVSYKTLSLSALFTYRKKGIPTGAYGTEFNNPDAQTHDNFGSLRLQYSYDLSPSQSLSFSGAYNHYYYEGGYPQPAAPTLYDASDGKSLSGDLQFRWDTRSNNRILLGLNYIEHPKAEYRLWDNDNVHFNNSFPYNQYSIYIQNEYQISPAMALTVGIRRDAYSTFGNATTPRIGLVYNPSKLHSVKLLYGEAFRAPSVYETNYEDPVSGYKRNPSIEPERIRTLEGIWEHQITPSLTSIVTLYNFRMSNLIDFAVDPDDELIFYDNIGSVQATGAEFEFTMKSEDNLLGYASYSAQYAEDAMAETKLNNSPTHLVKGGLSVPIPVFEQTFASLEATYESGRITVYQTSTPSYFLMNFTIAALPLTQDPTPYSHLDDHFELVVGVRNLLNTSYGTPGGVEHIQPILWQNGRNYFVRLRVGF